jgi:hypothetical protein
LRQPLHIIARHQHVAVGNDDPFVTRGAPAFNDIVELGIAADAIVANEEFCGHAGMCGDQAADQRQDRVSGGGDAEQDLVVGIIEVERRPQRLLAVIVDAAERANDADGGLLLRFAQRLAKAADRDGDAYDMDEADNGAKNRCRKNRLCHYATS